MIAILLGTIIYLNYRFNFEKKWIGAANTTAARFTINYILYAVPFGSAFFLQAIFYPAKEYYKNGWFWCIFWLAPALFSFRVNSHFYQDWIIQQSKAIDLPFYLSTINWLVKAALLLIPVWLIWWIKDRHNQPFYGVKTLQKISPYFVLLLMMVPLLVLASRQESFEAAYPKFKILQLVNNSNRATLWRILVFECCYGIDFVSIEFFFRGFLILALVRSCGMRCIVPAACFYCMIHLGKPVAETISSFFGGIFLGVVTYHTRSIWGGLLLHVGIAWLMEIIGWLTIVSR